MDSDERLVSLVHDLRTPLTIIAGFAELLQRRGADMSPEQHDEYMSRIAAAADDMRRMLDDERAERAPD